MHSSNMRNKGQVCSVGNYVMTGKVLGKGHFARVEEATHSIIGRKVAVKIIDLTCIKEEYARRNLHREPRVMAKLRHPCIAALYETMMNGPRLYVVMEAAGGGDLCAHVLGARAPARGLPEQRARALAAQLVSAVRHMHARGVVHRDLKMENIMLDSTKQFIKIVDFGLSNIWSTGATLRTPCGSLEYAAPELFVDGRKYGPEVDLWSIGVIVYGMVTGGLPFTGAESGEGRSRPQLRAAITRGFTRKQRAALVCVSPECKTFIQHLLVPNVEERMKIEEAARHRWIKRPGMRMKTHPFGTTEPSVNREIYRQISELCSIPVMDVVAQIKAEPFGPIAGMYNVKVHLQQMQSLATDLLWSKAEEVRPPSPPEYKAVSDTNATKTPTPPMKLLQNNTRVAPAQGSAPDAHTHTHAQAQYGAYTHVQYSTPTHVQYHTTVLAQPATATTTSSAKIAQRQKVTQICERMRKTQLQSPRTLNRPVTNIYTMKKPVYRGYENGDGLDPRLPRIEEHSTSDGKRKPMRTPTLRKAEELRLHSCPNRVGDKRAEFYRKAGDGLPSWRASGTVPTPPRILLQNNAASMKRTSLGNIVSPHSSSNSHCKSERSMPNGWCQTRGIVKETHLQRLRRTAPIK